MSWSLIPLIVGFERDGPSEWSPLNHFSKSLSLSYVHEFPRSVYGLKTIVISCWNWPTCRAVHNPPFSKSFIVDKRRNWTLECQFPPEFHRHRQNPTEAWLVFCTLFSLWRKEIVPLTWTDMHRSWITVRPKANRFPALQTVLFMFLSPSHPFLAWFHALSI